MKPRCPKCASANVQLRGKCRCADCGATFSRPEALTTFAEASAYAKGIGHPIRASILAALQEGPASPVTLAAQLGEGLSLTAYHVAFLRDLDPPLVELESTRQRRGATEHTYRLTEGS